MTSRAAWHAATTTDVVHARAAGRAHVNSIRRLNRDLRAAQMFERYVDLRCAYGSRARIAREFGCSRSTVYRALRRMATRV